MKKKSKKAPGRKPGPPELVRGIRKEVQFNESEFRLVEEEASRQQRTTSEVIRELTIQSLLRRQAIGDK